jgi:hypothetical protein
LTHRSFILFLLFFVAVLKSYSNDNDLKYYSAISSLSKDALQMHIRFLGSDIFEGRGTGQRGGDLSAKYLALEFDKLGLIPLGDNATYYQYVPMHGSTPTNRSQMKLYTENETSELKLGKDYLLYKSGDQTFIPNPKKLVFAGYGINAPEYDYNDYYSINVENKIVVILNGEPISDDSSYFNGDKPTIYSHHESKLRMAMARGANGCIILPNPTDYRFLKWTEIMTQFAFEDVDLAYSPTANLSVLMNPIAGQRLFKGSEFSLNEVYRMHFENRMMSFPLMTKLSFKGDFRERDFVSPNIIGMIEGSDSRLKDSYIIITAHYDHLGIGPAIKGDSIYNGVFDNAIGVAASLELARVFSKMKPAPKRSMIFMLTTGEEKGLLGSRYYTDHPAVPLYKTIANLNIDGIALFDEFESVIGIGYEFSSLGTVLDSVINNFGMSLGEIPPGFINDESFSRSDQIAFAQAGIPSFLIYEGVDHINYSKEEVINMLVNYSENVYHTPLDDLNQPMNFDAALKHLRILFDFCYIVANSFAEPYWYEGVPYINERLRTQAEKR